MKVSENIMYRPKRIRNVCCMLKSAHTSFISRIAAGTPLRLALSKPREIDSMRASAAACVATESISHHLVYQGTCPHVEVEF